MATKAELENELRNEFLAKVKKMVEEEYGTDVLTVNSGEYSIPVVDSEGGEAYINVKVSIPRGKRNGEGGYTPYNGYEAAQEYAEEIASKAQEKAAKKAMKKAEQKKKD